MKKSFLKFFLTTGVILSLGGIVASCSDDKTTDPGPDPDPKPKPGENTYVITEGPTPVRYVDTKFIGSANGITIEATDVTSDNVKFNCKPGADVVSYRVQLYPLGSMYNTMINAMNQEKRESLTTTETDNILFLALNNTSSTATSGKLFNEKSYGKDFASYDFDYMNSDMQVFQIQPDIDYLIVAQAYFDEEGVSSPGDLCVCHVRTPKKELIGSPEVSFYLMLDYTGYYLSHIPNADCKYLYYLSSNAKEIDQYIDAYGEEMYRQFLCHYGDRLNVETGELGFEASNLDPALDYVATAVALDANGTAANKVFRKDFRLPTLPPVTEAAECVIATPDRIGGSQVEFNLRMEKNCQALRFQVLPKATVEAIMSGDKKSKEAYAIQLYNPTRENQSWLVENGNFSFDRENNKPTGDAIEKRDFWFELSGDTEYAIIYAGTNFYKEISELKATEVFRTKPVVRDNPDACEADLEIKVVASDRTSVTLEFSYNPDKTAHYYWQYYSPDPSGRKFPDVKDGSDEARYNPSTGWLYYFLTFRNPDAYESIWPNLWKADGMGDQVETLKWDGFQANTTYEFAYLAEDWNGVLSHVKFCTGVTPTIIGGPNPTISATAERQYDGTYEIAYTANEDTREIRYMSVSINDPDAGKLALSQLRDKDPNYSHADYVEAWEEYVMANGLFDTNISVTQKLIPDGAISVAMGMAIGGKDAGSPVYSELVALIFTDGKVQTLEEYLGLKGASTNHTVKAAARARVSIPRYPVQPGIGARVNRNR